MSKENPDIQRFGYRTIWYKVISSLIAYVLAWWFGGILGLVFVVLVSLFLNHEVLDLNRIVLTKDHIHITRYVKLTEYDCKFHLKDIEEAGVYLKKRIIKAKRPDGGIGEGVESYNVLHIILKDGSSQEVKLLGMTWFEHNMLNKALENAGISTFKMKYQYNKDTK